MKTEPSTEPGIDMDVIRSVQFHLRHRYLSPMEGHALYYLYERYLDKDIGTLTVTDMAQGLGRSQCRCRSYLKQLSRVGLITTEQGPGFEPPGKLTYRLSTNKPPIIEDESEPNTTCKTNTRIGYAEYH